MMFITLIVKVILDNCAPKTDMDGLLVVVALLEMMIGGLLGMESVIVMILMTLGLRFRSSGLRWRLALASGEPPLVVHNGSKGLLPMRRRPGNTGC